MPICQAITKKGKGPKCVNGDASFDGASGLWLCHLHHPDGLYRQQVRAKHEDRAAERAVPRRRPNELTIQPSRRRQDEQDAARYPTPGMDSPLTYLTPDAGRDRDHRLPKHYETVT